MDIVAGNTVCFVLEAQKCCGVKVEEDEIGCARIAIRVNHFYKFYNKLQPSKCSVFLVLVFVACPSRISYLHR